MRYMLKVAIVTPTYNEAKNIKTLLSGLEDVCNGINGVNFTVMVVDDSSPDGTAKVALDYANKVKAKNFSVEVLIRKEKDGIGKAYIYGFNEVIKRGFDYVIQIDADLSHNPKYIADLVAEAKKGTDFITTSRYMPGGAILDWDIQRRILSLGGNLYTRFFLGSKITDYTTGLNMFSVKLLKKLDVNSLEYGGYAFFTELKYLALLNTDSYDQIPLIFTDRQHGKSKMPKNTVLINLFLVPKLRFSKKRK